ncbi:WhiB family transcriptional regulator [Kineococcus sp. G2]|uniref:WhiB family transcriptional regulator n=1 Tax=Kineococcus sp. G2 TaxID=3127484 RepID=UPI00301D45CC
MQAATPVPATALPQARDGRSSLAPPLTPSRGAPAPPCRTVPADLFFAEEQELVLAAKALCSPCPLRAACLAGALARREPAGVWGGQLFVGGVAVAYRRGRGRPRKDAPPLTPVL